MRKTTRPAKYYLIQILYEYAVEVTKRFKELDLVNSVSEELWTEVCIGGSEQNHPKEKEKQEGKVVIWGGFTNSWREKWKAREKGKGITN